MIEKNKILDKIFKKLIKEKYSIDEIKLLINLEKEFSQFHNFIYYLYFIANKNIQDIKFNIAKSIFKYLEYLITEHKIEQLTIDKLKINQCISKYEIYLLGARGLGGSNALCFDIDENFYISLDQHPFNQYKNIINVALGFHEQSFLSSLTNQGLLTNKDNEIFIFIKNINDYEYLGVYKIKDISQIYIDYNAYPSIILTRKDYEQDDTYLEYLNLNKRNFIQSFEMLKSGIKDLIINNKNNTKKFLDLIDECYCHYILIYNLGQHSLIINDQNLLSKICENYGVMLKQELMLPVIIPENTYIDQSYLSLFANTYDILMGIQINTDFMNNIYSYWPNKVWWKWW